MSLSRSSLEQPFDVVRHRWRSICDAAALLSITPYSAQWATRISFGHHWLNGWPTLPGLTITDWPKRRSIWRCVWPPTSTAPRASNIFSTSSSGVVAKIQSENERGEPWKQSAFEPFVERDLERRHERPHERLVVGGQESPTSGRSRRA